MFEASTKLISFLVFLCSGFSCILQKNDRVILCLQSEIETKNECYG